MDLTHTFTGREALTDAHTDAASAYIIEDYPYGRLRCQMRVWMEYRAGHGFRKVTQTQNPKTGRWNAPKKSTYYPVMVLTRDLGTGHIGCHTLGNYETDDDITGFETYYAAALTPEHRKEIRMLRILNRAQSKLTFECRPVEPGEDMSGHRESTARIWGQALQLAAREIPA